MGADVGDNALDTREVRVRPFGVSYFNRRRCPSSQASCGDFQRGFPGLVVPEAELTREIVGVREVDRDFGQPRSEEHTSELQSLMRTSYAVFCLKKKNIKNQNNR